MEKNAAICICAVLICLPQEANFTLQTRSCILFLFKRGIRVILKSASQNKVNVAAETFMEIEMIGIFHFLCVHNLQPLKVY